MSADLTRFLANSIANLSILTGVILATRIDIFGYTLVPEILFYRDGDNSPEAIFYNISYMFVRFIVPAFLGLVIASILKKSLKTNNTEVSGKTHD